MINQLFDKTITPTGSAAAYTANYNYGGKLSVDLGIGADVHALITRITLDDDDNVLGACKLHLFSAAPASTVTNNAALTLSKADRALRKLVIPVAASDFVTVGSKKQAFLMEKSFSIKLPTGVLHALLTIDGATTFTTTTPLTIGVGGYAI